MSFIEFEPTTDIVARIYPACRRTVRVVCKHGNINADWNAKSEKEYRFNLPIPKHIFLFDQFDLYFGTLRGSEIFASPLPNCFHYNGHVCLGTLKPSNIQEAIDMFWFTKFEVGLHYHPYLNFPQYSWNGIRCLAQYFADPDPEPVKIFQAWSKLDTIDDAPLPCISLSFPFFDYIPMRTALNETNEIH